MLLIKVVGDIMFTVLLNTSSTEAFIYKLLRFDYW